MADNDDTAGGDSQMTRTRAKHVDALAAMHLDSVRADIPILATVTYLNSASCSPVPAPVMASMADYYMHSPVNYRSGETPFERKVTARVDAIRESLAEFLGATSAAEVVFTKNTTEAINFVAAGIEWAPGDEVVVTPIEHQSNLIPWMRLADREGVALRYVRPESDGRIDPDSLADSLSKRTRLVAIHHVSNILGTIQDVSALSRAAHRAGALLLVDAAQSEGRIPVNVTALGCDFLAGCARKGLMGPQGVGFLWGRKGLLRSLEPLSIGGQAAIAFDDHGYRNLDLPFRHEGGILNTVGVIGLGAALEYTTKVAEEERESQIRELTDSLVRQLGSIDGLTLHSPGDTEIQAGVVSWSVTGHDPLAIAEALFERGRIVVAAGTCGSPLATQFLGVSGVVRTSVHRFNSFGDVEHLVATLQGIVADGPSAGRS